ncbi:MAG TPA: DoxX family protein [Blastocatellia bacterium]|nr:DoxX family protein [Blastocatellia bacterium]
MIERKDVPDRPALVAPAMSKRPITNYALWIVQVLLALLFLFAGGVKLVLPAEALTGPVPVLFLRFIGLCEVLGAIGLILPGLLRIRPALTPLAAAGLVIIMIGATVINLLGGGVAAALITLLIGSLAAFVSYGRSRVIPHGERSASHSEHSRLNALSSGS